MIIYVENNSKLICIESPTFQITVCVISVWNIQPFSNFFVHLDSQRMYKEFVYKVSFQSCSKVHTQWMINLDYEQIFIRGYKHHTNVANKGPFSLITDMRKSIYVQKHEL